MTTLKSGGDLPEHHGHWELTNVTYTYSFGGKKQFWRCGGLRLEAKNPKDDDGIRQIVEDTARRLAREMQLRPPLSIRRTIG
jgi:hypothetical protein